MMLLRCVFLFVFTAYAFALHRGVKITPDGNIRGDRFAGGTSPPGGVLPFIVNILTGEEDDPEGSEWLCQGVVIAENVTLTAASCLYDVHTNTFLAKENIYLINGKSDKTDLSSTPIGVSEVVIYPGFKYYPNPKIYGNDLAMLIPKSNFPATNVVPLDKKANNKTADFKFPGGMLSWGSISDDDGNAIDGPNTLQGILTNFRNHKSCEEMYASFRQPLELAASHLCLNNTAEEGVCKGDAGAPVFMFEIKKDETILVWLVAIASKIHNDKCPTELPSVVSRVAPHLTWISTKTGKKVV